MYEQKVRPAYPSTQLSLLAAFCSVNWLFQIRNRELHMYGEPLIAMA